jgi:hypothetical protein
LFLGETIDELTLQEAAYRTASAVTPSSSTEGTTEENQGETENDLFLAEGGKIRSDSAVSSDNSDSESEDGLEYLSVASKGSGREKDKEKGREREDTIQSNSSSASPNPHSYLASTASLSSREPDDPSENLPPTVNTMDVTVKKIKMVFDGPFENNFEEELLTLTMEKLSVSVKQDKNEDDIQDEIAALDLSAGEDGTTTVDQINPDNFVVYSNISGGQVRDLFFLVIFCFLF